MDATCYVLSGKAKSERLCNAFAAGVRACGGRAQVVADADELRGGAAVFYGVRPHQLPIYQEAKTLGRDVYYIDNAYFDATRETYFRITRNRLQHSGTGPSDGRRFGALGLGIKPWLKRGEHILVCPQSDEFLNLFCPQKSDWTGQTHAWLSELTDREIRVRPWQPNKIEWYRSLPQDLKNCWALVTFSSASAITAVLAGIPAFVTADDCISRPVANLNLADINAPKYSDKRHEWACVVADQQFTIAEIASGMAWRALNANRSL